MLTIHTRDGYRAEAVVTVHPMRAGDTNLAALVQLRIPAPREERFVDPALMRRQMLDDTFTRIGDPPDIDHLGRELMAALVPNFCNAGDLLLVDSLADDELPAHGPEKSLPVRRITVLHDREDPTWEAVFPTGRYSATRRVQRTTGAWKPARPCSRRPSARARPSTSPRPCGASPWPSCSPTPPCSCCR